MTRDAHTECEQSRRTNEQDMGLYFTLFLTREKYSNVEIAGMICTCELYLGLNPFNYEPLQLLPLQYSCTGRSLLQMSYVAVS